MADSACQIMVVEDTDSHVLLAKAVLEKFGVSPIIAHNYDEAIEIFNHRKLDLIFMDLQLPAKSGYEITYEIRRLELEGQKPPTPIVAVTAYLLGDAKEKCNKAGMDDCVAKPLTVKLCKEIFGQYLKEKKLVVRELD